jgi:hypothetical protein
MCTLLPYPATSLQIVSECVSILYVLLKVHEEHFSMER